MLNVGHVKNDVKWRPIVTKFGTLIENMSRTRLHDYHIFQILFDDFMRNSNFGIGVLHVKVKYWRIFLWRYFSTRSSLYCFIEYGILRGVYDKILKFVYGSVFVIWLYLQKAMYRPCDLDLYSMKVNIF